MIAKLAPTNRSINHSISRSFSGAHCRVDVLWSGFVIVNTRALLVFFRRVIIGRLVTSLPLEVYQVNGPPLPRPFKQRGPAFINRRSIPFLPAGQGAFEVQRRICIAVPFRIRSPLLFRERLVQKVGVVLCQGEIAQVMYIALVLFRCESRCPVSLPLNGLRKDVLDSILEVTAAQLFPSYLRRRTLF